MSALSKEDKEFLLRVRDILDKYINDNQTDPAKINETVEAIRTWEAGTAASPVMYTAGDVRKQNDIPYRCAMTHTHHGEADWDPAHAPSLWAAYHGTSPETARPWTAPTGAHDQYLAGEYIIYTNGNTYKCKMNTIYSPTDYAQAWEVV